MKKTFIILTILLAAIWLTLALFPGNSDYKAEKLLYSALKLEENIAANPEVVPPAISASIEKTLLTVINKYPKATAARVAEMKLAEFYAFLKKYDKTLDVLNKIIRNSKDNPVILTQAILFKANLFEKENRWPEALDSYETLRDKYSNTTIGLEAPFYIANHYTKNNMNAQANAAYEEAAAFYTRKAHENEGKMIGYWSSILLMQSYINLKRFDEAGRTVEGMLDKYPSTATYIQNLPWVELIYIKQLNQPERALAIYKKVEKVLRDQRLLKILKKKISGIEAKLK